MGVQVLVEVTEVHGTTIPRRRCAPPARGNAAASAATARWRCWSGRSRGVGAFEVGSGYSRQAPLQRIARRPLAQLVDRIGQSAHLAVLHGRDVLYVVEERAPGRPPLVTDVGVRLPAHLTASGRAILAELSASQVRALYPDKETFVDRTGSGPQSPTALRAVLAETRRRGYAVEDGEVTVGVRSIAVPVVDHNGHPVAGIAVTYPSDALPEPDPGVVSHFARLLSQRLGARTA